MEKAKQKSYDELYERLATKKEEKDLYQLVWPRDRAGRHAQQVRMIEDRDRHVLTSKKSVMRRWKDVDGWM